MFLVALDGTITAVANPVLAFDLSATLAELQWVTTAYLVSMAATLVVAGRMGDRFGKARIFLVGIAGFSTASVGVGLAPTVELVVASRGLQGLFGALIVTNALSILRTSFARDRLAAALSTFAAVIGAASAGGPVLGGLLVDGLGWRWAFLINAPLGLISVLVGIRVLSGSKPSGTRGFDAAGTALLSLSLVSLAYGLIRATEHSWTDRTVVAFLGFAAVAISIFAWHERRAAAPLLPLTLLANRTVAAGVALSLTTYFSLAGCMFFVLLFLQTVRGESPSQAGLSMLPLSLANVLGSAAAGPSVARHGPRPVLVLGMTLTAAAFALLATVPVEGTMADMIPPLAIMGLGLGLVMTASIQAVLANVGEEHAGAASGLHQTATQLGAILGTAVLGAVMGKVVAARFAQDLEAAAVPQHLVDMLERDAAPLVAQGVAPVDAGMSPALAEAIRTASEQTFTSGMHVVMIAGAVAALVGALLALLVSTSRTTAVDPGLH